MASLADGNSRCLGHDNQWPPQSPQQALLSSPSGRKKYREMLSRTSPSPSPRASRRVPLGDELELDDDDDEETLQLKLQELQARLRLKKLQKAKGSSASPSGNSSAIASSKALNDQIASPRRARDENVRPGTEPSVQVPASPVKQGPKILDPTSPRRVQLGIDKGLKAKDISLKRAPHIRASTVQHEPFLRTSRNSETPASGAPANRPLTFSERLARKREEETEAAEKRARAEKARSKGFGIGKDEMEDFKKTGVKISEEKFGAPVFSREEVLSKDFQGGALKRSKTAPSGRLDDSNADNGRSAGSQEGEGFEPFSSIHLSRRHLPQRTLARNVAGKKIMTIKDLLRDVKAPDFSLPDVEQDIVVMGIVAKKSEPRAHKPGTNKKGESNEDRGKYMVMSICDLEYEVDLFLFNTGFERFWKLTEATVVAILNPNVMPPPAGRQDTGRFSLVINSDEDTIIEIGNARDLGYCKSIKKDGSTCNTWINKKRTEFCEFHTNEALRKTRGQRVEIASSAGSASFAFGSNSQKSQKGSKWLPPEEYFAKKGKPFGSTEDYWKQKNHDNQYDWETKTKWYISKSMSSSDLIDGKGFADTKQREELLKKKLAKEEQEREIAKKLGSTGNAAGKEYMKRAGSKNGKHLSSSTNSSQATGADPSDALAEREARHQAALKSLDLSSRDRQIHLGSIKRKRPDSSNAGSTLGKSSSSTAFGWGGGLRDKLARMREGEKLRNEPEAETRPPVRKKTRFVTEKGIREAGRESLGAELNERMVTLDDDDDDDELVIVK